MEFIFIFILIFQGSIVFLNSFFKKKGQNWSTGAQNLEQTTAFSVFALSTDKAGIFPAHFAARMPPRQQHIYLNAN